MHEKKLKLYVWEGVRCDAFCGVAFALAESPEHAKELVIAYEGPFMGELDWDGLKLDGVEPVCYTEPSAYVVSGGN